MSKILVCSHMRCGSTLLAEAASLVHGSRWKILAHLVENEARSEQVAQLPSGVYKTHARLVSFLDLPSDWHLFTIRRPFHEAIVSFIRWQRNASYPQGNVEPRVASFIEANVEASDVSFVNKFIAELPDVVANFYSDSKLFHYDPMFDRFHWFTYGNDKPCTLLTTIATATNTPFDEATLATWEAGLTRDAVATHHLANHVAPTPSHEGWLSANSHNALNKIISHYQNL